MNLSPPLVSICIANYNNATYLAQAIDSALQQTVQDLEVIVCDNQSTDNSLEVARSFTDPRVRVFFNERNLGIYGNFARTAQHARGTYLKFLCADDWLERNYLEATLEYFEKYSDVGLVSTRQIAITNMGRIVTRRDEAVPGKEVYSPQEYLTACLRRKNPIGNPSRVIVRRDVFDEVGGFNVENEYAGDLELWLKIASKYFIASVPKVLCYERMHTGQSTHLHVMQSTDIRDDCQAYKKSFDLAPGFWTVERRIELCRYAFGHHVRHAIAARLKGEQQHWNAVITYMSELCSARYWLPYHVFAFPWVIARAYLYRRARKLGIERKKWETITKFLKVGGLL